MADDAASAKTDDPPPALAPSTSSAASTSAPRKFLFLKPAGTPTPLPELPDSYFEPTVGELARAHAGQVSTREKLVDGPLLTKRLRDEKASKEAAAKRARFPNTRIRVKFANRSQLETTFSSSAQLPTVYAAIRESFVDEHRETRFVLYQTPPMRRFDPDDANTKGKSLYDLQLAPASVFYILFADQTLNDPSRPPPLRPELLDTAEDIPAPPTFDEKDVKREPPKAGSSSATTDAVERTKSGTALPKWLKTESGHK